MVGEAPFAIDVAAFRRALGTFITGVTVVTLLDDAGQSRGLTANSFTSVSLDPALILVCIAKASRNADCINERRRFAVNVLAEDQRSVSAAFSSKTQNKFLGIKWRPSETGNPLIEGVVAWFDCTTHQIIDAGDHLIVVGKVLGFGSTLANPLGYCRGGYVKFSLSQEAVAAAAGHPIRVGAILERDGSVLLVEGGDGSLTLPRGTSLEPVDDPESLKSTFRRLGLDAQLTFIFSVFEEPNNPNGEISIYYRGILKSSSQQRPVRLIPFAEVPWERIVDSDERKMVSRYINERTEDSFGVFAGSKVDGTLRKVVEVSRL
jgi:flavin reductase (DIM6/NTAB) family NADH-FMN oxidoreductase RutF